jgi:endogenous inhibitor of DNA gyrase (YacG/DUF329 family)
MFVCFNCQKELKDKKNDFCSSKCMIDYFHLEQMTHYSECTHCNKELKFEKDVFEDDEFRKFCSVDCFFKFYSNWTYDNQQQNK